MLGMPVEGMRMLLKRFAGVWGLSHAGLVLGIVAACFSSTGFSEPIPSAADRVFLGDTLGIPLAANANPETIQTLKAMRQQAANNGTVRVIVGVRAAFAPEGLMSANNVSLQRNEIAAAQSAVLNKVASLKQKPKKTKRFENIPFLAVEADPAELEALASLPEITSIEEDRLSKPTLTQSVPLIGGATAWSSGYTGTGQTVAILDTGVDKAHPFLTGKVVSEACYSTNYAPDGATSVCPGGVTQSTAAGSAMPYGGTCPAGECDHGTHVAGIVAGASASYSGVAKDASLIAIQVFTKFQNVTYCGSSTPCAMAYTSDIILGLQRAYALRTTYSIAAVNMSLGGGQYFSQSACDAANTSRKAAIDTLRSVNIATVISSGNDGYVDSMGSPGCISSAVSVGATWDAAGSNNSCAGNYLGTSMVDQIACYSNSASFLNLLAPGSLITSSIPYGMYSNYQGTSMAAPHVAGAWALLKQKKATLTVTEGLNALSSTGVSVTDTRNGIVKPRININAALNAIVSGCSYTLSSASFSAGAAAAIGNVSVTATVGCAWTAASNVAWITVTSGASGNGNGAVGYSIAANTTVISRTGTLTIAGKTFTVTQNGTGTLPVAPTIGTATAGNASARVAFTPGAIGSGTLLNYTASCSTNNVNFINATGSVSPITVSGLINGTAYTCKVRAASTVGIGPLSAASNSVTPAAPISATGSLTTTFAGGNSSNGNMFDVKALSGNLTVNRFALNLAATAGTVVPVRVYYKTGSYSGYEATPGAWTLLGTYSVTSAGLGLPSSMPVGNLLLASGQTYGIYLTATDGSIFEYTNGANTYANADIQATLGAGIAYPFVATFTPRTWNGTIYYSRAAGTLPAAPAIGIATPGNGSARVAFTPGMIGSGTLVSYTAMCGTIAATGTGSPITVTGLTNGIAYTCKVRTTSTVGIGPWSALSNTVTPSAASVSACTAISPATPSVTLGSPSPVLTATCNNSPTSYVWKVGATTLYCTGATCVVPAANLPAAGYYNVTVTANNASGTGIQAASTTITVASAPLVDTFPPGGILPAGWVQPAGSSAPWVVATDSFAVGPKSLKSGIIADSQSSGISYTTAFASGNINFALRVSSESGYDYLRFYIDGVVKGQWSGEAAWQTVSFPVTAGTHTVIWKYEKDEFMGGGSDAAWIDSVSLPTQQSLSACSAITPVASSVTLGTPSTLLSATCNNSPTGYIWKVGATTLNCNGATCTVPAANLSAAGTYSVTVRANNVAGAGSQAATATITVNAPPLSACTAITPATPSVMLGWGSPLLTATCNNSPTAYVWRVGTTTLRCTGATCTIPAAGLPTVGTYNVTVRANNAVGSGTQAASATITVSNVTVPLCSLTASPLAIILGGSTTLTATCPGAISYTWAGPGAPASSTASTIIVTPASSGAKTYTVTGTNASGSSAPASVVVNVSALPLSACTAIAPATVSVTVGSASPLLTATCSNTPTSYVWKVGTTTLACTGATCTVPAANLPTATTYTVTVTANNAGGTGTQAASTAITVTSAAPISCPQTWVPEKTFDFNWAGQVQFMTIKRGQASAMKFTTGSDLTKKGSIATGISSQGPEVAKFMNISTSKCDFNYANLTNGSYCATARPLSATLAYTLGAPALGRCKLQPNTTYYVNIRNENANLATRGIDTCAAGANCSFAAILGY